MYLEYIVLFKILQEGLNVGKQKTNTFDSLYNYVEQI